MDMCVSTFCVVGKAMQMAEITGMVARRAVGHKAVNEETLLKSQNPDRTMYSAPIINSGALECGTLRGSVRNPCVDARFWP